MNKNRCCLVCLVVACLLMTSGMASAGPTLTCGGRVFDAADTTSADGGTWTAYNPDDANVVAEGTVGEFGSRYWAGEVGAYLDGLAISDELLAVIEKEADASTVDHKGYYAVMNHTLSNGDPAEFNDCTLREIPVPSVEVIGDDAHLNWDEAMEDSADVNITGYNVFRSADGLSFTKISTEPLEDISYTDLNFPGGTWYYAVALVYRGTPERDGQTVSANSEPIMKICKADLDGDGDVDGSDLAAFAYGYANGYAAADLNGDTFVDMEDMEVFAAEFGQTNCPVPE